MKKLKYTILSFVFAALTLPGCRSNDNDDATDIFQFAKAQVETQTADNTDAVDLNFTLFIDQTGAGDNDNAVDVDNVVAGN